MSVHRFPPGGRPSKPVANQNPLIAAFNAGKIAVVRILPGTRIVVPIEHVQVAVGGGAETFEE